jgi:transcriptional regulator with XRE-family HTH domain
MRKTKSLRKPSSPLTTTLAANIRSFREDRGISQEDLADACGLHRTYVGSVERGERNVTLSTLEAFASVMGVSVPQLLTGKTHKK